MIGTIYFSALVLLCIHIFNISTSDFNAKLTAMEYILKVLSYHGQIDAQISTNSGQIRPKDPQEHKEKLQVPCYSKFSRKETITSFTWHEMRQFQQPHHYTVCQWGFYPIVKTCKKWVMTLSSSMAMYSVMRDIPDARKVPIERGWVAFHLYATCKFSNHLTLEQWAFEYGLPLFWYALYIKKYQLLPRAKYWCEWSQSRINLKQNFRLCYTRS